MINDTTKTDDDAEQVPAPTLSGAPERELELKLKKNPNDRNAKVDLGSDESMDASDPVAATAPGGNKPGSTEPAPSSGFPEGK